MTFKTCIITASLALILGLVLSAPGSAQNLDTAGDGVRDAFEALLGTDPLVADTDGDGQNDLADTQPTFVANPITTTVAAADFAIKEAPIENKYDVAAKADATDSLELLVTNTGSTPLTEFSIYFSITDAESGAVDGMFRQLDGFSVPAGGEARIHFDDAVIACHFRANPNSIYTTSQAAKIFSVTLTADGFAPVSAEIANDAGGAETAN